MQDHIFASHTCFGGHMDVNCYASLQTLRVFDNTTHAHSCDCIVTPYLH